MSQPSAIAQLHWQPAHQRPDLMAAPVTTAVQAWEHGDRVQVAEVDPDLADTQALIDAYDLDPAASANCVVVAGKRGGELRVAACVVLPTTRADVNGLVRRELDVRKASFLSMDDAITLTSMEYGGITPVGLPPTWRLLVDDAVVDTDEVLIGSGVRRSKLLLPGPLLAQLPGAQVLSGLGMATSDTQ